MVYSLATFVGSLQDQEFRAAAVSTQSNLLKLISLTLEMLDLPYEELYVAL